MKMIRKILTKNPCFKVLRELEPKGIVLSSLGRPGAEPENLFGTWNRSSYGAACPHAVVNPVDGSIYQTLPFGRQGWHCKTKDGNTHYLAVFLIEPPGIKYLPRQEFLDMAPGTTKTLIKNGYYAAVDIAAFLCKMFELNPLANNVILSREEAIKANLAKESHLKTPEVIWSAFDLSLDQFRSDVKAEMAGGIFELKKFQNLLQGSVPELPILPADLERAKKRLDLPAEINWQAPVTLEVLGWILSRL